MEKIQQTVNTTARMVVAISEKSCGCYVHMCQAEYKMRPKRPIYNNNEGENPKSPKHNPRRWIVIKFAAQGGKLNSQLPEVITFAYDLGFGYLISCWKDLFNIYKFWLWSNECQRKPFGHQKCQKISFRASKQPQKFGTQKTVEK